MTARFLTIAIASLALAVAAPAAFAAELSEAELYFELNDSAGDLGIHSSIDGGPYVTLEIEDAKGRTILWLSAFGRLAAQGMTQFFLESAEPPFDELAPATFFQRFPEGRYEIEAVDRRGVEFEATVRLSHVMAARPGNITANGVPAVDCDAPVLPTLSAPVVVDWDPVTHSHPTIGKSGPVEIVEYQFFAEREGVKFSVELPPTVTEFEIPAEVLALGDDFKYEIIARTASGNNTAVEACFLLD
jgi:hypothetical protein